METTKNPARQTYRMVYNLTRCLVDVARFHAETWDDVQAIETRYEREVVGLMPADEAQAIIAAHDADVAARRAAGTYKGGRPPQAVLRARKALAGEVHVEKLRGVKKGAAKLAETDVQLTVPGGDLPAFVVRVGALRDSVRALAVRESQLQKLAQRGYADDVRVLFAQDETARAAHALYMEVREVWPHATAIWDQRGHLSGEDAATRNNDGTHHTASNLGNATTIRNDETATARSTNKRHHNWATFIHKISEQGIEAVALDAG